MGGASANTGTAGAGIGAAGANTGAAGAATRVPREAHCVSRKNISNNALSVLSRLRARGYQAFLVGGAVRDLLLGGHPKDFDIATDATPEEVRGLFRSAIIIGRRFRIVHVRFGREVIEVTTFRGHHGGEGSESGESGGDGDSGRGRRGSRNARQAQSGMLLRDNVFGSLEEDAMRRDFSVNALYYCSGERCVYDYVGGMDDLRQRRIRIIGDAEQRYREDPVRMLRAARFAAKLNFDIAPDTAEPVPELAGLLDAVPEARLFDELLKLFLAGFAERTFRQLERLALLEHLFPVAMREFRDEPTAMPLARAVMRSTDARLAAGKPVTPAFVLAGLLWPPVLRYCRELEQERELAPEDAMQMAGQAIIFEQRRGISMPRRFTVGMQEIWELQLQLPQRDEAAALNLLAHRRFRAAYDFLLLREEAGEDLGGLGRHWTAMQEKHPEIKPAPYSDFADGNGARRDRDERRRRRGGRRYHERNRRPRPRRRQDWERDEAAADAGPAR